MAPQAVAVRWARCRFAVVAVAGVVGLELLQLAATQQQPAALACADIGQDQHECMARPDCKLNAEGWCDIAFERPECADIGEDAATCVTRPDCKLNAEGWCDLLPDPDPDSELGEAPDHDDPGGRGVDCADIGQDLAECERWAAKGLCHLNEAGWCDAGPTPAPKHDPIEGNDRTGGVWSWAVPSAVVVVGLAIYGFARVRRGPIQGWQGYELQQAFKESFD